MADVDRRLGILAASVMALLVAGCIGGDTPTGTAQGLVGDARDAAAERVDDPTLVRVTGLEPLRHDVDEGGDERREFWLHLDDDNADGQAPGWLYTFRDGTARFRVAVYANGDPLGESLERGSEGPDPQEPGAPLEGWEVDTDEVAETLADHPEWDQPRENHTVRWSLAMREGEPLWTVTRSEGVFLSSGRQMAVVHAGNGTVLNVTQDRGFESRQAPEPDRESAEDRSSGTVSPSGSVQATVDLEGPGRAEGILEADASELGDGGGTVTFELLRDEEVRRSTTVEDPEGGTWNLTVENARPGEWTARASTDDDVRDVTVTVRGNWTE